MGPKPFSNSTFSPQFRVPKDITYTKSPAKVRFSINDGLDNEAFGSVSGISLSLGSPSNDVEGPIITFESESGLKLKNGDILPVNQNLIINFVAINFDLTPYFVLYSYGNPRLNPKTNNIALLFYSFFRFLFT